MNRDMNDARSLRARRPLLRILVSFPIACFTCALLTDTAYAQTANMMWADFSAWLLAVGMAGGVLAGLAGLVTWLVVRRSRTVQRAWIMALGGFLTLVIALANNFVHSRDAWTSVVPLGVSLSAATVIVMLATTWLASGDRSTAPLSSSGIRS